MSIELEELDVVGEQVNAVKLFILKECYSLSSVYGRVLFFEILEFDLAGVATTFINKNQDETILMDLKALLLEAGQKIPPFLEALSSGGGFYATEIGGVKGCAYCGGLGHRIAQCPKLETQKNKQLGSTGKDYLTTGSRYGGTSGYSGDW